MLFACTKNIHIVFDLLKGDDLCIHEKYTYDAGLFKKNYTWKAYNYCVRPFEEKSKFACRKE